MQKSKFINQIDNMKTNCDICRGCGYVVSVIENDIINIQDCECVKKAICKYKYIKAGIPDRYIGWNIDMLYDKFKKENDKAYEYLCNYINNLKDNIENGASFWMASTPGLAKSSIAAYIVRCAVDIGYDSYFCTAAKLLSEKFNALGSEDSAEFIDYIVNDVRLLVIEELEKVYLKDDQSMSNHLFYELLADIYDAKNSIIITTNQTRDDVCKRLPEYIVDRLYTVDYFALVGKYSGRKV